jgi:hypothetical protein
MDHKLTSLERPFQLARSGYVSGLSDIMKALERDGYATSQIKGPALRRQLSDLVKAAALESANAYAAPVDPSLPFKIDLTKGQAARESSP